MARNLFRRIEVAYPVLDPALKKRVITEGLKYYLKDNTNSWELLPNGTYRRRKQRKKQTPFGAQQYLAGIYDAHVHKELQGPTPSDIFSVTQNANQSATSGTETITPDDSPLTETMPEPMQSRPDTPSPEMPAASQTEPADR